MGNLKTYTVSRHAADKRAPEFAAPPRRRGRKRAFGLALVTVFGVAAGGALGAALYHYDRDSRSEGFAAENAVPPAFAAAVEAIFDTSSSQQDTDDLHVNSVTPTEKRIAAEEEEVTAAAEEETTASESGLTWTPGEAEKKELPNVVVVSSRKKAISENASGTQVASLLPLNSVNGELQKAPQKQILAKNTSEPAAETTPVLEFVPQADSETQPKTVAQVEPKPSTNVEPQPEPQPVNDAVSDLTTETIPRVATEAPEGDQAGDASSASTELLTARALKEKIEADLNRKAAAAVEAAHGNNTDAEAAAVPSEGQLASLGTSHFVALPEPVSSVAEAIALENGWTTKAAKHVNLRAKPSNKGAVLGIVPAGAELLMTDNCGRWCAVMYEGKKGYVHRTFVTRTKKPQNKVEVAETEAEVAALEKRMAEEGDSENFAVTKSTAAFAAKKVDTSNYRGAFSTKYVNMRISPKKNAKVMGVIPVDSEFKVEPVCKHWCGVEYNGRHGYIYRTYFEYIGKEES